MIDIGTYVKIISKNVYGYVVDIRNKSMTCTIEGKTSDGKVVFYNCQFDDVCLADVN